MSIHTGGTQVELLRWLLLSLAAVAALHASEIAWVMAGFMPCACLNAWKLSLWKLN